MDSQFFANILLRQHQHNSFVKRFHELWNFWAPIRKQFNKRGVVSIYNLVAQVCLRLAVRHCFFFTWSQLRKEVSVWQRSYHSPTNENLPWEKLSAFLLPSHPNTHFVFLPTRLSVTSIFFLCWALLSQIVSSVENILSHNPLLGITWRCQPDKILHKRSSFFHRKSSRIVDLTLVKKAAMRTVWPRHRD